MLLLSTSSLTGYGLHRIFDFAKKAGYDGLDISLGITNFDLWDTEYIMSLSREFHIPVLSLTAPARDMSTRKFQDIMEMVEVLGVQSVTFSPPHLMDKDTKWFSRELPAYKTSKNMFLTIQNVEPKFLFFVIPEYRNASFEKIQSITNYTSLDITAVDASSNMDIIRAQALLGSSLKNIFFADKNLTQKGLLPGNAGGGLSYLPLESFLMKLKSVAYTGNITIKVSPKELGVGDTKKVMNNLLSLRSYCEKYLN